MIVIDQEAANALYAFLVQFSLMRKSNDPKLIARCLTDMNDLYEEDLDMGVLIEELEEEFGEIE